MTQFLPPNLLALFAPREAIPFLPPNDKLPHEKKRLPYGGLTDFLTGFEVREKHIIAKYEFSFNRNHMKHHRRRELKQKKNDWLAE